MHACSIKHTTISLVIQLSILRDNNMAETEIKQRRSDNPNQPTVGSTTANMVSSVEENEKGNPQTMNLPTVIELMRKFKEDIISVNKRDGEQLRANIKSDLQDIKQDCIQAARQESEKAINESEKISKLQSEVAFWKIKSETMSEVCNRLFTEMGDLTSRVENIEFNNTKKKLIITGLPLVQDSKKRETLQFLNDFLNTNLGIQITVDDYFTLGNNTPKPIVIILQSIEDKRLVLDYKSYLKGYRNMNGKSVYINDYYPTVANKKRRREQKIIATMKENGRPEAVSYVKGNMAIDGQVYVKQILPPTPKSLIDVTPEEMENILRAKTIKGDTLKKQESEFTAYMASVESFQDIQTVYKKIKMLKPDARHVCCSYRLSDPDIPDHIANDFQDDGEPGAGRVLLDLLEYKQCKDVAVFVARKYGGVRMGVDRLTLYQKAAKSALGFDIEEPVVIKKPTVQRKYVNQHPPQRGALSQNYRGRGVSRGGSRPSNYGVNNRRQYATPQNPRFPQQNLRMLSPRMQTPQMQSLSTLPPQQNSQILMLQQQVQRLQQSLLQPTTTSVIAGVQPIRHAALTPMPTQQMYTEHFPPLLQQTLQNLGQYQTAGQTMCNQTPQKPVEIQSTSSYKQHLTASTDESDDATHHDLTEEKKIQSNSRDEREENMDFQFSRPITPPTYQEEWSKEDEGKWHEISESDNTDKETTPKQCE